jgi:endonuclease YncB( thermonuclease family)
MILSRNISFATSLVLTAIIAAGLGYYAGAAHVPEARITAGPTASAPQTEPDTSAFPGPFAGEMMRVVDGDTFKARVQIWFGQEITTSVRVRGFDAPEIKGKCAEESKAAQEATKMLREILASGPVTLHNIGPDKYFGRVVASVHVKLSDGRETDVAQMMIAAGLGRPYNGGTRGGWCEKVAGR